MFKRVLQRGTALSLVAVLSMSAVAPATAATIVGNLDRLEPVSVNNAHHATLTIAIKGTNPYDNEPSYEKPRGDVEGYTFNAALIDGIDLTTEAGWDEAQGLSLSDAKRAGYTKQFEAKTDAKGYAHFADIPVGLYYVTATEPDNDDFSYESPQAMLLTVPVGQLNEDGSMWQYDVAINAKYAPDRPIIIPPIPIIPIPGGSDLDNTQPRESGVLPKPYNPDGSSSGVDSGSGAPKTREGGAMEKELAETGASVIWIAVVAVILILTGFVLLLKKRRDEDVEVRS